MDMNARGAVLGANVENTVVIGEKAGATLAAPEISACQEISALLSVILGRTFAQ